MPRRFNHLIVMARLIPGYFVRRAENTPKDLRKHLTLYVPCAIIFSPRVLGSKLEVELRA